jgi:hypothetical protein
MKGYRINNFSDGFSCVLKSWFDIIMQYEEQTYGDAIYWYNERANIGSFAAALARNKISVIEEYSCLKGKGADKGPGRVDLSFCYRKQWYLVESKIKWLSLTPKGRNLKNINIKACEDAKRSWQQATYTIPLGLTFVVPSIGPQYKERITECVQAIIKQLENDNSHAFWAYCAPGRLRELQTAAESKNYYPMVFLLANVLKSPSEALNM